MALHTLQREPLVESSPLPTGPGEEQQELDLEPLLLEALPQDSHTLEAHQAQDELGDDAGESIKLIVEAEGLERIKYTKLTLSFEEQKTLSL